MCWPSCSPVLITKLWFRFVFQLRWMQKNHPLYLTPLLVPLLFHLFDTSQLLLHAKICYRLCVIQRVTVRCVNLHRQLLYVAT